MEHIGGLVWSGRRKQRITIARALLKRSNILVFDEANSAVNAATNDAVTGGGVRGRLRATLLGLVSAVALAGCTKLAPLNWQEEVALSTGQTIVVTRKTEFESGGGGWASNPNLRKPSVNYLYVPYPAGSGKVVAWRSAPERKGNYPEDPLLLGMEEGKPVIIAAGTYGTGCPSYRRYLYTGSKWQQTAMPDAVMGRPTNLLFKNTDGYITLDMKRSMNNGAYDGWRKKIDPALHPCPVLRFNNLEGISNGE